MYNKTSQTSRTSQTGSNLNPESWNLKPEGFTFPASVQSDLFNYLKPHQQAILKPYLRIVKRPYQQKLCNSLLDYLEGHGLETFSEPVLAMLQEEIVQECDLRPLTTSRIMRPLQGLLDRVASIGRGRSSSARLLPSGRKKPLP